MNTFTHYCQVLSQQPLNPGRFLLLQVPQFLLNAFNVKAITNRGYYAYPPMGLQVISTALSDFPIQVEICDINYLLLQRIIEDSDFTVARWLELVDSAIAQFRPTLIGVTCISVSDDVANPDFHLTCLLRHLQKAEKIVILGGTIASDNYAYYLEESLCHFVVSGEGENKIRYLLKTLLPDLIWEKSPPPISPVSGIYYRSQGTIHQTQGEKDKVFVQGDYVKSYENIPIEKYCQVGCLNPFSRMAGQDTPFATLQLNRGCRANCKFCGVGDFMGQGVRQTPVEYVINELHYLCEKRGIRHFEFLDDDFLGGGRFKEGAYQLLQEMANLRQKIPITWAAGNGLIAASLNRNVMDMIRDSGCIGFRVGIESANQEILKQIRKPASFQSLENLSQLLPHYPDIFVAGNYIIGFFGSETFSQMLETFRFSLKVRYDWANYSTFQVTSKTTANNKNFQSNNGKGASEFIPVKNSSDQQISAQEGLLCGIDIFNLPLNQAPNGEQVKEIWFTFNMLSNYLFNKNLDPGGNPAKLYAWLTALCITYPYNPYLSLFQAVCATLLAQHELALSCLQQMKENLHASHYWQQRFNQFHLDELSDYLPHRNPEEIFAWLTEVRGVIMNNILFSLKVG